MDLHRRKGTDVNEPKRIKYKALVRGWLHAARPRKSHCSVRSKPARADIIVCTHLRGIRRGTDESDCALVALTYSVETLAC